MIQTSEEFIRKFNERALKAGMQKYSEDTGYLHYHYHSDEVMEAIPLLENFLFAYSLLKNRTAESIQQGKDLLSRLLYFQNFQLEMGRGNFPIYLHDYPFCKDRALAIHLLPVYYYILKQFESVLGSSLKDRLVRSLKSMVEYAFLLEKEAKLEEWLLLKLSCSAQVIGELLEEPSVVKKGEELSQLISLQEMSEAWFSPKMIAEILLTLQMIDPDFQEGPWRQFFEFVSFSYDNALKRYIGPASQLYYQKKSPQKGLYDLFLSYYSRNFPEELFDGDITELYGSLIQPTSVELLSRDNSLHPIQRFEKRKGYSFSLLDHQGDTLNPNWKGVIPFHFLWKNHSLVAQGGNYQTLKGSCEENRIVLEYDLSKEVDLDDRKKAREVILSFTKSKEVYTTVNGERATTFSLEDKLVIHSEDLEIAITFQLLEGEGRFIGHLMAGNRASQLSLKKKEQYNAYDWQLFLRTLERLENCRIAVIIEPHQMVDE